VERIGVELGYRGQHLVDGVPLSELERDLGAGEETPNTVIGAAQLSSTVKRVHRHHEGAAPAGSHRCLVELACDVLLHAVNQRCAVPDATVGICPKNLRERFVNAPAFRQADLLANGGANQRMAEADLVAVKYGDRGVDRRLERVEPDGASRERARRCEDLRQDALLVQCRNLEYPSRRTGELGDASCEGHSRRSVSGSAELPADLTPPALIGSSISASGFPPASSSNLSRTDATSAGAQISRSSSAAGEASR
jgi:hypothetical protein